MAFAKGSIAAREAGRKGGRTRTNTLKGFAANPDLAREAGRKGGSRQASEETRAKLRAAWVRRKEKQHEA